MILILVITTGCRRGPAGQPPSATPRSLAGDPVGEAYTLLMQRTAGQIDETEVAAAGIQGLRLALMSDGVIPPEVPTPSFTGDQAQDLGLLRTAVLATTNHYGSKLSLAQADDAVIASMALSIDD